MLNIKNCKIIQIVHALWLAIKPFYMSVCKHGFCSSFHSISWKLLHFMLWFPTLISCSPNLPRVYIRLCKHRNHFTFLQFKFMQIGRSARLNRIALLTISCNGNPLAEVKSCSCFKIYRKPFIIMEPSWGAIAMQNK